MDYSLSFVGVTPERQEDMQMGLENLLGRYYSIMGSRDLQVEDVQTCIVVYPRTGKIDAVLPIEGALRRAEFKSSNPSAVRFQFNGRNYVVNYSPKSD